MEEDTCFNCGNFFERREKGYKRKLISSLKIPIIKLNDILEKKISIPLSKSNKFICNNCASLTVRIYKHNWKSHGPPAPSTPKRKRKFSFTPIKFYKRKCMTSTPVSKQQPMTSTPASKPIQQLKKEGFKDKVIEYILESRYPAAFKLLLKKSRCARDGLINTLKAIIRREVKCAEVCSLQESLSLDSLSAFQWPPVLKDISAELPVLTGVLESALSCHKNRTSNTQ